MLACARSKCKQLLEKLRQEQQSALRTNTYQTTVRAHTSCAGWHAWCASLVHEVRTMCVPCVNGHHSQSSMLALQSCPICLEDFTSESVASGSRSSRSEGSSEAGPSSGKAAAADSSPLLDKLSGGKSGTAAKGSEQPMQRTPLALPCGHRFCTPCITRRDCFSFAWTISTLMSLNVTRCTACSVEDGLLLASTGGWTAARHAPSVGSRYLARTHASHVQHHCHLSRCPSKLHI